jgi:hypothetical protein
VRMSRPLLLVPALIGCVVACAHPRQIHPKAAVEAAPAPASLPAAQVPSLPAAHAPIAPAGQVPAPEGSASVAFASQVQPILKARCRPCHFAGGQMYGRLPFDRAATILELREKLFSRIKGERDRATIREFLAQHPTGGASPAHQPGKP